MNKKLFRGRVLSVERWDGHQNFEIEVSGESKIIPGISEIILSVPLCHIQDFVSKNHRNHDWMTHHRTEIWSRIKVVNPFE